MKKFLIYTSAGLNSNVKQWASASSRDYDIWVTNYSATKDNLREYADFYNETKGGKFPNFKQVATEHREQLSHYVAIMVADDDIIISPEKLNKLFAMISEHQVWVVTPAFSKLGKISHETTARQLLTKYRYTNFAEVTCPIIRTDKLLSFMDVFDAEIDGFGVDWWYLNHLGKNVPDKIIISDEYYCVNPRDFHKTGGAREIDRITTAELREKLWSMKKIQLGIDSFKKRTFSKKYRNVFQVVFATPAYLTEQLYAFAADSKRLIRLRKFLKKYFKT